MSRAIGRRWYEETSAAEETDGVLSTIAVLILRSMACTVDACVCQPYATLLQINLTSIIRHKALMALALYTTSLPTAVSFMILLVTIIMSSAVWASSLITKYTICRSEASLFWNSFEIPKKREVASLVGNFSPVKRRREILVKRIRHLLGETGEVLKTRAVQYCQTSWTFVMLAQCLPS